MSIITKLSSNNDKKIERILEAHLIKYDNSKDEEDRFRNKLIIDTIYSFERTQAERYCNSINRSIGFAYFINNYKNYKKSLNYFSYKLTDELLFYNEELDVEEVIHEKYNSYESFKEDRPKAFLIDIISKYDEELSDYIKVNMNEIDYIDRYLSLIESNWDAYELDEDKRYENMFCKLKSYYNEKGYKSEFSIVEILIYLSNKNNIREQFQKNYIMEDLPEEDIDLMFENIGIDEDNISPYDMNLISNMDNIIKKSKNKKIKRLNI